MDKLIAKQMSVKYICESSPGIEKTINSMLKEGWSLGQFTAVHGPYGICIIQQMIRYY